MAEPGRTVLIKNVAWLLALRVGFGALAPAAQAEDLAKNLFGAQELPAAAEPRSYGFYSKGCFSGGMAIAADGPTWQAATVAGAIQ